MRRPTDVEQLDVYRGEQLAGMLERTQHGSRFTYAEAFLDACGDQEGIAFHLPSNKRTHETQGANLHPYFAGLLPEGLRLTALVRRVRTSPDDLFSLLVAAGWDTVGDVSAVPGGDPVPVTPHPVDVSRLEESDFEELFLRSVGEDARALEDPSLPGVQPKLSAAVISFPVRGKGSPGHILKLNSPATPRLVENEAFFLLVARACDIPAATASVVRDRQGRTGLLVERFDRFAEKGGGVLKTHVEDGCQFLNRYPADKYRLSLRDLLEGLEPFATAPRVDGLRLLRQYAFSYLIGNSDLHAKNVSLWLNPESRLIELSPAYDVLSTLPYRAIERRMALRMDAKDGQFRRKDFEDFGKRHRLPAKAVSAMLDQLCEQLRPWLDRLDEIGFEERDTKAMWAEMMRRFERLER